MARGYWLPCSHVFWCVHLLNRDEMIKCWGNNLEIPVETASEVWCKHVKLIKTLDLGDDLRNVTSIFLTFSFFRKDEVVREVVAAHLAGSSHARWTAWVRVSPSWLNGVWGPGTSKSLAASGIGWCFLDFFGGLVVVTSYPWDGFIYLYIVYDMFVMMITIHEMGFPFNQAL